MFLASIKESTIAQYTKPLRHWWTFCKYSHIDYFIPPISASLKILALSWRNVHLYSIGVLLNTYNSAVSRLSSIETRPHLSVKSFFKGATVLTQRPSYYLFIYSLQSLFETGPCCALVEVIIYPFDISSFDCITKKLVIFLVLTTTQRMQTLAAMQILRLLYWI